MDQTGVISSGSTRRRRSERLGGSSSGESQQLPNKTQNCTSLLGSASRPTNPGAGTVSEICCMMNGAELKMEHTMMLTNKGRCRAGGKEAMRDGAQAALTTGSR